MFLAESYIHQLDPFAIQFTPTLGLRWYGLSYAVGFLLAWVFVRWVAKKSWSPIPARQVGDLMFNVIVGVLLGGRLGYAVFYEPRLFTGFSSDLPYWDLLAINKGGMASHGGMIGVILAVWWFAARRGVSTLHVLDVGAMGCTPGLFFGRIANFINAELWGKSLPQGMQSNPPWWSVKYPTEITEHWLPMATRPERMSMDFVGRLASDFGISAPTSDALRVEVAAEAMRHLEALEPLRALLNGGEQFYDKVVAAAYAGNEAVIEHIAPMLTANYPSQLFQALTDGPLLMGILVLIWLRPRKPGVVGAWFLIAYGVMRIVTELWRQPDFGVETFMGLSRGQLLSVLMIAIGVVCLIVVSRRDVPKLGGLFSGDKKTAASE